MHKNITISDLNVEIQGKGNSAKKHAVAKAGIAVIEFLLASVLYCYGIILSEYICFGSHSNEEGIRAAILFVCSYNFTEPFARFASEYFEDRKNVFFRYLIGFSTVLLFIAIMIPDNLTFYMIFGGIFSSVISTQIRIYALDKLDMDNKIFEALRQVARAVSLFIMPHLVCVLTSNPDYDVNQVRLIFGSILLNIIPAALIIKTEESWRGETINADMTRYQTMGRFAYQMKEMKDFNTTKADNDASSSSSSEEETPIFEVQPQYMPVVNNEVNHIETTNTNNECSKSTHFGMENFGSSEHTVTDLAAPSMHLSPVNVQSYFCNVGVSILPGIPEENEDEDVGDINNIDPKRLSVISIKLEGLNILEQIRRDSIKEVFTINEVINENKPEPINKIEYIPNFKEAKARQSVLEELRHFQNRSCFHCSPYKKYIWTRRLRMTKDFLNDNFFRPLYHALKNLYFYPSLTSKVVTDIVSTLYITLAPFVGMKQSWKQSMFFSTENVTFLLTYVAFAWCFFLLGLPLVLKLSHSRIRIAYGFGLVIHGTSLLVLSAKLTNEIITLSSLLFGFGYGVVTFTEKIVFKTSIGMRPWYLVRGPLEVLSAIFILFIYFAIDTNSLELSFLLLLAALSYYFNAVIWFCLPFMKYFISIVKRIVFDERSQQDGFFH